ncbi:glucoside xylosyltransferase 2-like, partial [Hyalella azteca]|uniref:Glucoside xylosyltransferase 2-like n=1 Tax=Hyalella azteca TaxID=294128 RepID=A0A979FHJ8_HYAAZ
ETALKSAVYLATRAIRFYVVTDDLLLYTRLGGAIAPWPPHHRLKLDLQYLPTWGDLPPHLRLLEDKFRPCSCQRLLLPHLLPHEEAVIYLDTDVIFLAPPDLLWAQLRAFGPHAVLGGAAPTMIQRGAQEAATAPGPAQPRLQPGDWQHQDLLNHVFNQRPALLHPLPCPWNFRWPMCEATQERCPALLQGGAYAVHGIGGAFVSRAHPEMVKFHATWASWQLTGARGALAAALQGALVPPGPRVGACAHFRPLVYLLTNQLWADSPLYRHYYDDSDDSDGR